MSANIIDWNASRESDSFGNKFFVVDFRALLFNEIISESTNINNFSSYSNLFNDFGKNGFVNEWVPFAIFPASLYLSTTPGVASVSSWCYCSMDMKITIIIFVDLNNIDSQGPKNWLKELGEWGWYNIHGFIS